MGIIFCSVITARRASAVVACRWSGRLQHFGSLKKPVDKFVMDLTPLKIYGNDCKFYLATTFSRSGTREAIPAHLELWHVTACLALTTTMSNWMNYVIQLMKRRTISFQQIK